MKRLALAIMVIVLTVLVLQVLDWGSKHFVYVQQRTLLLEAIQAGQEYDALKRTVSYLQGSATRTLNNLKSTCLYMAPLLLAAFYIYRKER